MFHLFSRYSSQPLQVDTTVLFFLSLCMASETDLGYDPLVEPTTVDNVEQYIFRLELTDHDELYRTTRPLSEHGAYFVVSHGTRVWEVEQLNPETRTPLNEPLRVLKHGWVEPSRALEGDRYRQFQDYDWTLEERALVDKHFLKLRCDSQVKIGARDDTTFEVIRRGQPFQMPNSLT